ncbi:type II RES/Xre toxin-antitoxin system antitoxin [Paraburkholderia sp. RL17-373-BIF-A]|uniref:type II RES/Xre toxin-antitoxin system antitoxin n=1 Tax=Paraburkholderia sp. RL17-373-BIF-A TaxID=3031629 RepID=UPI0038B72C22
MTAEAVAGRPHSRRTKPGASAAKSAVAARLAHIGTNGLGAQEGDLTFFLGLAPTEQSRLIRDGMEAVIVSRIATELLEIPVQTLLASLRLPSSTINRKIAQGERLSAGESDRAARTMLIYAQAKDVLEDGRLAAEWMLRPNVELGGERPLDTLDTQTGIDRVRDILVRLEHGVTV